MGSWYEVSGGEKEKGWEHQPASSFGLVTELVARDEPAKGREGVIHLGSLATVCFVEQIPSVGDVIRGQVPGIVEKVKITRGGRVLIYARPLPATMP